MSKIRPHFHFNKLQRRQKIKLFFSTMFAINHRRLMKITYRSKPLQFAVRPSTYFFKMTIYAFM